VLLLRRDNASAVVFADLHDPSPSIVKQSADRLTAFQVLFDNLKTIFPFNMAVPYAFRVDDNHRTVAALIETTGLVDANLFFQAPLRNVLAQLVAHIDGALIRARLTAYADKDVLLKYFHEAKFSQKAAMTLAAQAYSIFKRAQGYGKTRLALA
jgi:hypothetical protein